MRTDQRPVTIADVGRLPEWATRYGQVPDLVPDALPEHLAHLAGPEGASIPFERAWHAHFASLLAFEDRFGPWRSATVTEYERLVGVVDPDHLYEPDRVLEACTAHLDAATATVRVSVPTFDVDGGSDGYHLLLGDRVVTFTPGCEGYEAAVRLAHQESVHALGVERLAIGEGWAAPWSFLSGRYLGGGSWVAGWPGPASTCPPRRPLPRAA